MIGRSSRRLRLNTAEPELGKIERLDERIDHTNRIILVDPIIEALGQTSTVRGPSLDKALHSFPTTHPRRVSESRHANRQKHAFSHSQGQKSHFPAQKTYVRVRRWSQPVDATLYL